VPVVTPQRYEDAIEHEMRGHPREGFLTFYPANKIQSERMIPILENDGQTGVLVWNHGDGRIEMAGGFNNSSVPGAGMDLLRRTRDQYHVNFIECFEPLDKKYAKELGFHEISRDEWNDEYAPAAWDYDKMGRPSVVYMGYGR
jgi:hypothetical protein